MGCKIDEVKISPLSEWAACGTLIMLAEAYALHKDNLQTRYGDFGEIFRNRMVLGGLISSADYNHAMRGQGELIEEFNLAMANFDVIITAVSPGEASKINAISKFAIVERPLLTIPFNVTGSPAMSVCCGYTGSGLPLSMQIIGKRFDDATVLRVADAYERATSWRERRPLL